MGSCVICGSKAMNIESIFFQNGKAFLLILGKNYCCECAGKRVEELRKIIEKKKNMLLLINFLKRFEKLKEIE